MAKIRVYELAKNLNMTNKALLTKMEKMNISVGSHMSSLDDSTVELIKTNLFGKKESEHDEKRVRSTVIRRRKKSSDEEPEVEEPAEVISETEEIASEEIQSEEPVNDEHTETEPDKIEVEIEKTVAVDVADEKDTVPEVTDEAAKIIVPVVQEPEPVAVVQEEENSAQETAEIVQPVKVEPDEDTAQKNVEIKSAVDVPSEEDEATQPLQKKKKKKKFTAAKIIKLPEPGKVKPPVKPAEVKKQESGKTPALKTQPKIQANDAPSEKVFKKGKKQKAAPTNDNDLRFPKKKSKRKTIVEGNALYAGGRGRKGRKGSKGGKGKQAEGQKTQITTPKAIKRRIKVDDTIILAELAKRMGIKASEMIAKLMGLGVMATVNQTIDYDTAAMVASEFSFDVERASFEEDILLNVVEKSDDPGTLSPRPPVVTIMGHVDHGKTSLLDVIRKSSIADGEAGGITQHIGAYNVETQSGQVVFLDTPGHEAFTSMRARGAKVTDIVILVVAADDGVMPQTIEALNHAKAAEVPIIVAVNKIDKEGAEPDRVKRELSDHGVVAEDWGGDTIFVNVSAKQKIGISDLLEMILLQSEVLELKANHDKFAIGHVVESKLDSGRGPLATILVQEGTLKTGQSIVCGIHYGKIRAMFNDQGKQVNEAGPSIPVEVIGLTGVPEAGDELVALAADKDAKQVSLHRSQKARSKELAKNSRLSLEGLFEQMEEGIVKDLNLIIKADVHGSIEALKETLGKLATSEVKINVIHSATGTVSESDISLAAVSNAIILGFNVRPATKVQEMAKEENVDMRFYDIIYDAIKDLKDAMVGLMESTFNEVILGRAEVRETFVIPKKGTIAGCFVTEGLIKRGQRVRLLRDGIIVYDGNIASLKRFKDDAKEVLKGYECGIGIENFNDIKLGDTIDCYMLEEVKPTLD